jgi:hypothetical protein
VAVKFTKVRLNKTQVKTARIAAELLSERTGEEYQPVKLVFGKYLGIATDDLIIVVLTTFDRPGSTSYVAFTECCDNSVLFPYEEPTDFDECCRMLGLDTSAERQEFQQLLDQGNSGMER